MQKRYMSIWFRHLLPDRLAIHKVELIALAFVFAANEKNRKVITAINSIAEKKGLKTGMPLADAKALVPDIEVFDYKPGMELKLLRKLGEWCIRYTPWVGINAPDGLVMDISGCAHLWGGERAYYTEIISKLRLRGYEVRGAVADTIGAAWAVARFGEISPIVKTGQQVDVLLSLPPAALRLDSLENLGYSGEEILKRLHKLGMHRIGNFINIPRSVLRRRFGEGLLLRMEQALGIKEEQFVSIQIPEPYRESLPSLEPIRTATGIEIGIQKLLEKLCLRLKADGKGVRHAVLTCYRIDGKIIKISIGTHKPSNHLPHLFKLLAMKIDTIKPALGIELFVLEATKVDDAPEEQEALFTGGKEVAEQEIAELLDRIEAKIGGSMIAKYLPAEHYWPERSIKKAASIAEQPVITWKTDKPRPTQLLVYPERVEVTAPIPDYPPMLFIYKGKSHLVKKADGPERIEREWWLEEGEHRDYYLLEDEDGKRYWVFRSGHYAPNIQGKWFLHGFFA
ncbi:protein ImuB [Pedobacter sp. UYP30]|uniref:Y-family DNA polymerase n=1 Tax=Pedobacter sp. UYP30 TaxID=1756400 RepID=UPI0033993516